MPGSIPSNCFRISGSALGGHLASFALPAHVANTDALTAQSDPDNPYGILLASDTYHANVIPLPTYGASYAGLTAWTYADSATATVSQAAVVRVYGHIPNIPQARDVTTWPQDVASNFLDLNNTTIPQALRGLWIPLTKPGYTAGTPEITLTAGAASRVVASTSTEDISEEGYVFLRGCDHILVTISTALTLSAGSTKKAVIVASMFG